MAEEIISIDCDLRRLHAWSNQRGVLLSDGSLLDMCCILADTSYTTRVLYECASPQLYGGQVFKKKLSWMIFNAMAMGVLECDCGSNLQPFLVAPSSKWTHGYSEAVRHKLAGVEPVEGYTKAQNHDLKECQAMQFFYLEHPTDWMSVSDYVETL